MQITLTVDKVDNTCDDDADGKFNDSVRSGRRDCDVMPALLLRVENHRATVRPLLASLASVILFPVALVMSGKRGKGK